MKAAPPLRYGTFCSGIEAVSVAWGGLRWQPVFFSEIEPFPCHVLKTHYPDIPNLGDMTRIDGAALPRVDVIVAGTPCQSFSVAGLRAGLDDERGNLTLDLVKIYEESRTPYLLWENVPGVFSDRGNAFGCFLGALSGENEELLPPGGTWSDAGYVLGPKRAIAWRVLDAQYFGLAQRRRRVFLVASPRDGADPRTIFFEWGGLRRDTAPRRKTGADVAGSITSSAFSGGAGGRPEGAAVGHFVTQALTTRVGTGPCDNKAQAGFYIPDIVGQAVSCKWSKGTSGPSGDEHHNLLVFPINTQVGLRHKRLGERTGLGIGCPTDPAFTLQGAHSHAVAFAQNTRDEIRLQSLVRRLTPLECERLQGFPDNYTALTTYNGWRDMDTHETPESLTAAGYKVRQTKNGVWRVNDPDGPRYKALGNSMAVNVMRWLGVRLGDAILATRAVGE